MKKFIFLLFLGLIAFCGPPKLFAKANKNATVVAKNIFKNITTGQVNAIDLFVTKTVAADQKPILPEYTGKKDFFINLPASFANIPGTRIFYLNFQDPKTPVPPGFGQGLLMEA